MSIILNYPVHGTWSWQHDETYTELNVRHKLFLQIVGIGRKSLLELCFAVPDPSERRDSEPSKATLVDESHRHELHPA